MLRLGRADSSARLEPATQRTGVPTAPGLTPAGLTWHRNAQRAVAFRTHHRGILAHGRCAPTSASVRRSRRPARPLRTPVSGAPWRARGRPPPASRRRRRRAACSPPGSRPCTGLRGRQRRRPRSSAAPRPGSAPRRARRTIACPPRRRGSPRPRTSHHDLLPLGCWAEL